MNKTPPKYFLRFFRWFCDPDFVEDIEGDLLERFEKKYQHKKYASWLFMRDVLLLFRAGIIRKLEGTQKLNYYGMFKHNLLISLRGFQQHKTVFGINLTGLIASLTCVLFSIVWIDDELKKDRMHQESDKLFQVYSKFLSATDTKVWRGVTGLLEPEIEAQIPQVEAAAVTTDVHEYTLSVGDQGFKAFGRFADEDYLKILHYPLWKGDRGALKDPSNILITKSLAKKLFGREDVVDETVDYHFWALEKTFRIAGVLEDITPQTSKKFEFILPWTYYHDEMINYKGWGNFYGRVLIKLDPNNKEVAESKINEIFQSNVENDQVNLFLTSYADQYLYGKYENGVLVGGRIDYVNLAIIVSVFILIIACINFVNLSTAFASLKTKEIGVKKSFGASRCNLAFQFFFESILLSFFASIIALALVFVLLEPFNQLSGKELSLVTDLKFITIALLFVPCVGAIAGIYPAIYLSNLEVIAALKAKLSGNSKHSVFGRQALVFVQFTLSIILIVGTLIVNNQMEYVLHKNLGYDSDNLLYFLREGKLLKEDKAFAAEMKTIPGVLGVSRSTFSIGPDMQNRTAGIDWVGKEKDQQVTFWENNGDAMSVEILGLELVAGRNFDDALHTEENSVIFNETAIQLMGMENPVGQMVEHYTGKKEIIGVVKDFITESLHNPIEPAMFFYKPEQAHYILVKIEKGKELETVDKLETLYKEFNNGYPFEPRFVDQDYQAMYDSEMRITQLSRIFSGLAIVISIMGLFGLTIFQVQRRTKEIGIKKVLGADARELAFSMTYHLTKSIFVALIVALPVSYFLGVKWLENFADRAALTWWIFVLATIVVIFISWLTVGSQTLKAARTNPVDALKEE